MAESWHLILLLTSLLAGAISIFFCFRLMKRTGAPFAGSFFYYLVFLYIFGSYSVVGSGLLGHLLTRMEIDQKVIHSAGLYAIFIGIPFLTLAKFMFVRSILDFFRRKPSVFFILVYFLLMIAAFVLYGVYMIRLTHFNLGDYVQFLELQRWVFFAYVFIVYVLAFIYILVASGKLKDLQSRKYIRLFGSWYIIYMVLCLTPLALSQLHPLFRLLFLLFFLSWHLVPILFMNIYLEKHWINEDELPEDFESRLQAFVAKHEISKREIDVVRLIYRGLSNQEISEALFISLQTVKDHVHRIFVKTGVRNRVQLTNMIR